jgi:hypothetical protein
MYLQGIDMKHNISEIGSSKNKSSLFCDIPDDHPPELPNDLNIMHLLIVVQSKS